MKLANNLQFKTKFTAHYSMQFMIYQNYLISISLEKNSVDFYDLKTFERKFYLKRRRH